MINKIYKVKIYFKNGQNGEFIGNSCVRANNKTLELFRLPNDEAIVPMENILYYTMESFGKGAMKFTITLNDGFNIKIKEIKEVIKYEFTDEFLKLYTYNGNVYRFEIDQMICWNAEDNYLD